MPIPDYFGLIARYYDRLIHPLQVEKLAGFCRLPVAGRLLDAGGGTGRVGHSLLGMATHIVEADLSKEMLDQARPKVGLDLVCTDTRRLPFEDRCFERVVVVDAFHHIANQDESARELWRVLKPRGRLVIAEPDIRRLASKLIALVERLLLMGSHFLPPHRIAEVFRFEDAECLIEEDGSSAWVMIDKMAG